MTAALLLVTLLGDPCGMVPPIYTGQGPAIVRTGAQRTYVFYADGLETYVIRPGFTGKVDQFGMLIPFPSAPSLRKMPDEIFANVAAAIDPPEVVLDLSPRRYLEEDKMADFGAQAGSVARERPLAIDEVKVLHQEAVGMYEVVVLAAGSADALSKWMKEHDFVYPKGMDDVVNDYVKAHWIFVAEKTKVASKPRTDPKPGMKKVDSALPDGSSFDGFVQAMGFRFKVDHPVVPMRLSPYNPGDRRQVVYYLTDQPVKIDGIGEQFVVRQIPGKALYDHLTKPLPVRVIGGTKEQVTKELVDGLAPQRDPKPHNGQAKDLFASDVLALKTGQMTLAHEEKEKELLRVGEALLLRGPEIDTLHEAELEIQRDDTARQALGAIKTMTMTVLAGDFPEAWLKDHDLTISRYEMPRKKNDPLLYDAKADGPKTAVLSPWGYGGYGPNDGFLLEEPHGRDWYKKIWEDK